MIVLAWVLAAVMSPAGASMIAEVVTFTSLRFNAGRTTSFSRFSSSARVTRPTFPPLNAPASVERVDHPRRDVGARFEGGPQRLGAGQQVIGDRATEHGGVVLFGVAQRGVVEEEAHDREHLLVLGELQARFLRRRGAERVDLGERRNELAAADAATLVEVVDHGVVALLVVAVTDVGDTPDRLEVDVGDTELDLVLGHTRRRVTRGARDANGADEQAEHDCRYKQLPHCVPPVVRNSLWSIDATATARGSDDRSRPRARPRDRCDPGR